MGSTASFCCSNGNTADAIPAFPEAHAVKLLDEFGLVDSEFGNDTKGWVAVTTSTDAPAEGAPLCHADSRPIFESAEVNAELGRPCLHYVPFASRGELIRLIAAVGGLEMDEVSECEDKESFGSPGLLPCLSHGHIKMAQSYAIEWYIASISPNFAHLSPAQRALDGMFCKIKEDMLARFSHVLLALWDDDEDKKAAAPKDIAMIADKWFPVIVEKLPSDGFVNGADVPTPADLALFIIAKAMLPFGAAYLVGDYDVSLKYPRFCAHVDRVARHPAVLAYMEANTTLDSDPFDFGAMALNVKDCVEKAESKRKSQVRAKAADSNGKKKQSKDMAKKEPSKKDAPSSRKSVPSAQQKEDERVAKQKKAKELQPMLARPGHYLVQYAEKGDAQMIKDLVEHGAGPDDPNEAELVPLKAACGKNQLESVQALLKMRANVNLQGRGIIHSSATSQTAAKTTALHIACKKGADEIVKALLAARADPTIRNGKNFLPVEVATENKRESTARILNDHQV